MLSPEEMVLQLPESVNSALVVIENNKIKK